MNTENLVQWLAAGPLPIFAIFVGFIVALDVFVVEFTRDYEPETRNGKAVGLTSRMKRMAIMHAAIHSISFLAYMGFIAVGQSLTFLSIDLFDFPDGVGWGFLNLVNFLIIIFIWWTYRNKIKEDHSQKDVSVSIDRADMRFLINLLRALAERVGIGDGLRGLVIAGSVAVDMLAISALLKTFLLPSGDIAPASSFFGTAWLDVPLFALIIFATVWAMVIVAQALRFLLKQNVEFVLFLRVAEPVAVFYILTGSVRAFAQMQGFEYDAFVNRFGLLIDGVFAIALTFSIFVANRLTYAKVHRLSSKGSRDAPEADAAPTLSELWGELRSRAPFVGWALLLLIIVLACLASAYSTGDRDSHNHLIEATGLFAIAMVLITVVVLYLPFGELDRRECRSDDRLTNLRMEEPHEFWFRLLGTTLALATVCVYSLIVFGPVFEVHALITWSAYIVMAWALFDLRRWRFSHSGIAGREFAANSAELATAIGLSSSLVAIAAGMNVMRLIT